MSDGKTIVLAQSTNNDVAANETVGTNSEQELYVSEPLFHGSTLQTFQLEPATNKDELDDMQPVSMITLSKPRGPSEFSATRTDLSSRKEIQLSNDEHVRVDTEQFTTNGDHNDNADDQQASATSASDGNDPSQDAVILTTATSLLSDQCTVETIASNAAIHDVNQLSSYPVINVGTAEGAQLAQSQNANSQHVTVFLQMPSATCSSNQLLLTQMPQIGVAGSVVPMPAVQCTQATDTMTTTATHKGRGKSKQVKRDSSSFKAPLRPLAPRIWAVPMPQSLVIGSQVVGTNNTPLVPGAAVQPFNPVSGPISDAGQYFEVLGRCIGCFRFSRTTTYCRAEKGHRDVKATACEECESNGLSTVVCRRKFNHKAANAHPPNVVINTGVQRQEDVKEVCIRNLLPPCFSELQSITVHHADIAFSPLKTKQEFSETGLLEVHTPALTRKPVDYARGYLYPYSKEAWEQLLYKFCFQTGTMFRVRTGKRVNKKTDHGLANHNGKVVVYRAVESQLYNCSLGGTPRKRKIRDGIRRRKSRGSKLVGCPAVIHTRLIETEHGWRALEVTVPKLSGHLPGHPKSNSQEVPIDLNEFLLNPHLNQNQANQFDLMDVLQTDSEAPSHDAGAAPPDAISLTQIDAMRKQTRGLFLSAANMVDNISNVDAMKSVLEQVQLLHNHMTKGPVTTPRRGNGKRRKRSATEASLDNPTVLDSSSRVNFLTGQSEDDGHES